MFGQGNSLRQALKRFAADCKGAAAVEFGLVAFPFFLLTIGLAEVAMIGFAQTSMDHAVSQVARTIRTGQTQSGGRTEAQVKADLCADMTQFIALDCANLYLDVDSYPSFVNVSNTSPVSNGNLNEGGFGYSPGASSAIVVVRAYYRWHVLTPFFQNLFGNLNGGERLLTSSIMFRNEPYGG